MKDIKIPTIIDIEEVCKILRVKKSWVYDRTYRDEIPHYRAGRLLRFDLEKVLEWWADYERGPRKH